MTQTHMSRRRFGLLLLCLLVSCISSLFTIVDGEAFKYRTYEEMIEFMEHLNATYPQIVQVFVAQDKYNLGYSEKLDCDGVPCKHYVVHVTNHSTLPDETRPEIFISGALHGDERLGPQAAIELIKLMADYSKSFDQHLKGNISSDSPSILHTKRWIYQLVNTRSVYIMPMTNPYGYANNVRSELRIDPNRDYNYMKPPEQCMQTMTSRVVNEIWRDHIFQLAVTFHGGTRSIAYEWGSTNHYIDKNKKRSEKSPDDMAQFDLANLLSKYGGPFAPEEHMENFGEENPNNEYYPTGMMNEAVYGVDGGMEDWGYAASWENSVSKMKPFQPCHPTTFGGYDEAKTIYNNVTHRAFNILVETSNDKIPKNSSLGDSSEIYATDLDFYNANEKIAVGHVTRNIRLALMLIEMVQPYVRWINLPKKNETTIDSNTTTANSSSLDPSIHQGSFSPSSTSFPSASETSTPTPSYSVPDRPTVRELSDFVSADSFLKQVQQSVQVGCDNQVTIGSTLTCNSTHCEITRTSGRNDSLQLAWEVLGSLIVDETFLEVSSNSSFPPKETLQLKKYSSKTRRYIDLDSKDQNATWLFTQCIELSQKKEVIFVRAVAKVDQGWKNQGTLENAPSPKVPPQSHVVNARTNPEWNAAWNGHRVKASLYWYSPVLTIVTRTLEANSSIHQSNTNNINSKTVGFSSTLGIGYLVLGTGVVVVLLTLVFLYRSVFRPRKKRYMNIAVQKSDDDDDDDDDDDEDNDDGDEAHTMHRRRDHA